MLLVKLEFLNKTFQCTCTQTYFEIDWCDKVKIRTPLVFDNFMIISNYIEIIIV